MDSLQLRCRVLDSSLDPVGHAALVLTPEQGTVALLDTAASPLRVLTAREIEGVVTFDHRREPPHPDDDAASPGPPLDPRFGGAPVALLCPSGFDLVVLLDTAHEAAAVASTVEVMKRGRPDSGRLVVHCYRAPSDLWSPARPFVRWDPQQPPVTVPFPAGPLDFLRFRTNRSVMAKLSGNGDRRILLSAEHVACLPLPASPAAATAPTAAAHAAATAVGLLPQSLAARDAAAIAAGAQALLDTASSVATGPGGAVPGGPGVAWRDEVVCICGDRNLYVTERTGRVLQQLPLASVAAMYLHEAAGDGSVLLVHTSTATVALRTKYAPDLLQAVLVDPARLTAVVHPALLSDPAPPGRPRPPAAAPAPQSPEELWPAMAAPAVDIAALRREIAQLREATEAPAEAPAEPDAAPSPAPKPGRLMAPSPTAVRGPLPPASPFADVADEILALREDQGARPPSSAPTPARPSRGAATTPAPGLLGSLIEKQPETSPAPPVPHQEPRQEPTPDGRAVPKDVDEWEAELKAIAAGHGGRDTRFALSPQPKAVANTTTLAAPVHCRNAQAPVAPLSPELRRTLADTAALGLPQPPPTKDLPGPSDRAPSTQRGVSQGSTLAGDMHPYGAAQGENATGSATVAVLRQRVVELQDTVRHHEITQKVLRKRCDELAADADQQAATKAERRTPTAARGATPARGKGAVSKPPSRGATPQRSRSPGVTTRGAASRGHSPAPGADEGGERTVRQQLDTLRVYSTLLEAALERAEAQDLRGRVATLEDALLAQESRADAGLDAEDHCDGEESPEALRYALEQATRRHDADAAQIRSLQQQLRAMGTTTKDALDEVRARVQDAAHAEAMAGTRWREERTSRGAWDAFLRDVDDVELKVAQEVKVRTASQAAANGALAEELRQRERQLNQVADEMRKYFAADPGADAVAAQCHEALESLSRGLKLSNECVGLAQRKGRLQETVRGLERQCEDLRRGKEALRDECTGAQQALRGATSDTAHDLERLGVEVAVLRRLQYLPRLSARVASLEVQVAKHEGDEVVRLQAVREAKEVGSVAARRASDVRQLQGQLQDAKRNSATAAKAHDAELKKLDQELAEAKALQQRARGEVRELQKQLRYHKDRVREVLASSKHKAGSVVGDSSPRHDPCSTAEYQQLAQENKKLRRALLEQRKQYEERLRAQRSDIEAVTGSVAGRFGVVPPATGRGPPTADTTFEFNETAADVAAATPQPGRALFGAHAEDPTPSPAFPGPGKAGRPRATAGALSTAKRSAAAATAAHADVARVDAALAALDASSVDDDLSYDGDALDPPPQSARPSGEATARGPPWRPGPRRGESPQSAAVSAAVDRVAAVQAEMARARAAPKGPSSAPGSPFIRRHRTPSPAASARPSAGSQRPSQRMLSPVPAAVSPQGVTPPSHGRSRSMPPESSPSAAAAFGVVSPGSDPVAAARERFAALRRKLDKQMQ